MRFKAVPAPAGSLVGFVTEGHRDSLLQIAAAGHGGIAIVLGQLCQSLGNGIEIPFDQVESVFDLKPRRRIGDVLCGGTPVTRCPDSNRKARPIAEPHQEP